MKLLLGLTVFVSISGFDQLQVLTPKVEITIRTGSIPKIPLVLLCHIPDIMMEVTLAYTFGYPFVPLEIVECATVLEDGSKICQDHLRETLQEYSKRLAGQICYSVRLIASVKEHFIDTSVAEQSLVSPFSAIALDEHLDNTKIDYQISDIKQKIRLFSCRKCRSHLFSEDDLECHENYQKCASLFLNENVNCVGVEGKNTSVPGGKIQCPVCDAKLGSWTWIGSQCSCKIFFFLFPITCPRFNF